MGIIHAAICENLQRRGMDSYTARQLEKPCYIIVAFQDDRRNKKDKNAFVFDHVNITHIKLTTNSDVYPYERFALNFSKDR